MDEELYQPPDASETLDPLEGDGRCVDMTARLQQPYLFPARSSLAHPEGVDSWPTPLLFKVRRELDYIYPTIAIYVTPRQRIGIRWLHHLAM